MSKLADSILRVGVAFAFLYPPFAALGDPTSWVAYFPQFMRGIVDDALLLHSFGVVEALLAVWLLTNWRAYIPAIIMCVLLVAIVIFDFSNFDVVFRDLSIAAAAAAIAIERLTNRPQSV